MAWEDKRLSDRFGNNNPLRMQPAAWDGHRSVRLVDGADNIGLATTAYSYCLGYQELRDAAERIALVWNLHIGQSNDELRAMLTTRPTINCGGGDA
jgi:hypothetical protein